MDFKDFQSAPQPLQGFLTHLDTILGKSEQTVAEYFLDLRTFLRFIKRERGLVPPDMDFSEIAIDDVTICLIRAVTLSDAYSFLQFCRMERLNTTTTRARKVSCLRTFFKYLTAKTGQLEANPLAELDAPKRKRTLPKYLTLTQSQALLEAVEGDYYARDYCILTLFLNCGLRLAELCGINLSDISEAGSSGATLRVIGKGNKERLLYLNAACMQSIRRYRAVRPADGVKDRNALFISRFKRRISPKTVQHMVYQNLEKIGLDSQGYSVHKLRHTAATLMYEGGVDIRVLKDVLGHENLSTTQIYTHVSDQKMKQAANANPLAKIKTSGKKPKAQADE